MVEEKALKAIAMAAKLCQTVRAKLNTGGDAGTMNKEDGSPVTIADYGSQAVVCALLQSSPIVAEEGAQELCSNSRLLDAVTATVSTFLSEATPARVCDWVDLGAGEPCGRFWTLDPVDGTKGFLRNDQYAVALALIEDGVVREGLLACPAMVYAGSLGAIFAARRGAGCTAYSLDLQPLGSFSVNTVTDFKRARLAESVEAHHTDQQATERLLQKLQIESPPLRMDSQAKYAAVATGQAEIYLRLPNHRTPDYREKIWDHAAGSLIVEEAGGVVTDARGGALNWTTGRTLSSNSGLIVSSGGRLHETLISLLA